MCCVFLSINHTYLTYIPKYKYNKLDLWIINSRSLSINYAYLTYSASDYKSYKSDLLIFVFSSINCTYLTYVLRYKFNKSNLLMSRTVITTNGYSRRVRLLSLLFRTA